jgi:hypothetical protein
MDWLILILGVPAILIPLVLLFGFAGCVTPYPGDCTHNSDCPTGTQCVDGLCVSSGDAPPPENLAAIALDDHSVALTWTTADPAATDFRIERAEDGDAFQEIPVPQDLSATGATDASAGLQEGVTYIYRFLADPSDTSAATVFPAAPVRLAARAAGIDQIDLSWDNASTSATEFSLDRRVPPGAFRQIFSRRAGIGFSDRNLLEGTRYEYRVFAVVDGVENDVAQDGGVKSVASRSQSATTLAFTPAFTGTLTGDQAGVEGFCVVQRLSHTLLTAGGTRVRIVLRGSTTGSLTLDKVTISQPADSQPGATGTEDPYDAAPDLREVASNVTIAPGTPVTVGPVNYTLDPTQDLLVAFDISNTAGEGNVRNGPLIGAATFSNPATAEAGLQDRATGYQFPFADNLALIEKIEVL